MTVDDYPVILKRAGALLARRACSRGELRNKLLKMAPASQVEPVLDRLEQLNLLNDMDYSYNFALCRVRRQGWSLHKVRDSLLRRDVPPETVESVLERVCGEVDPQAALAEYARKRLGKSERPVGTGEVHRLILHLRGRGYDDESIREALRQIVPATLRQRFETGD